MFPTNTGLVCGQLGGAEPPKHRCTCNFFLANVSKNMLLGTFWAKRIPGKFSAPNENSTRVTTVMLWVTACSACLNFELYLYIVFMWQRRMVEVTRGRVMSCWNQCHQILREDASRWVPSKRTLVRCYFSLFYESSWNLMLWIVLLSTLFWSIFS